VNATVNGVRDCEFNALGSPGVNCQYPHVGALVTPQSETLGRPRCSTKMIYKSDEKAVILTAAHCIELTGFNPAVGAGVNFDSQVVDDSTVPYSPISVDLSRVIPPDR